MEDRKRTLLTVIIALVLVVALLYSFGLNLFSRTPQLDLADPGTAESHEPGSTSPGEAAGITVEVTTETVQSVIASLSRFESYFRTVSITYYWGDGDTAEISARIWEDNGWVRTETTLSSGVMEHSIVGTDQLWLWYEDTGDELEGSVFQGPAGESLADSMQYIPTYEDVLDLDPSLITQAGYIEYGGQPCIYVEAEQQTLGYLYRYWISTASGLLMAAETEKAGVLVYQMESGEIMSPITAERTTFELPDGTVLHSTD